MRSSCQKIKRTVEETDPYRKDLKGIESDKKPLRMRDREEKEKDSVNPADINPGELRLPKPPNEIRRRKKRKNNR